MGTQNRLSVARCCCGVPGYGACTYCSGSGNNAPQYMTVEISGMADGTCSSCESYDGTYVCSAQLDNCLFRVATVSHCGTSYVDIQAAASSTPGEYQLKGWLLTNGAIDYTVWTTTSSGTKPSCLTLDGEALSYDAALSSETYCDGSSATFTVDSGDTT